MLRVVIDTNLWIRGLMGGKVTLPLLMAWRDAQFEVLICQELLQELAEVANRPRLKQKIVVTDLSALLEQLHERGELVQLKTIPPDCRDPQDQAVLATAIDGQAEAIVSGDADLRADDILRKGMEQYGIELWGIQTFLEKLAQQ